MNYLENAVNMMINNMLVQNTQFTVKGSFDIDMLKYESFRRCPKLTFIFQFGESCTYYDIRYISFIPIKYNYTTEIKIDYRLPYQGFDIRQVIEDNGNFDIMTFLKNYKRLNGVYPVHIPIATFNAETIWNTVCSEQKAIYEEFPGLDIINNDTFADYGLLLTFNYKYDTGQIYNMELAADNAAEKMIITLFGSGNIPPFLKVFLVFSYVQQNCKFNSMYSDAMMRGVKGIDIAPELAFGVLCSANKQVVSKGVASAVTLILTKAGIDCITIQGDLLVENSENVYYWNMAKLGDVWYHLDASWCLDHNGINVGRFMCNDSIFLNEHLWSEELPTAKGCTFNYDYIEEYINNNFQKLIAEGISEKYLRPDEIYA